MQLPDYYKTLELDRNATPEQVWLNFHKLEYLQERGKKMDYPKFLRSLEAYIVLMDEQARQHYDHWYDYQRGFLLSHEWRRKLAIFFAGFFSAVTVMFLLGIK